MTIVFKIKLLNRSINERLSMEMSQNYSYYNINLKYIEHIKLIFYLILLINIVISILL